MIESYEFLSLVTNSMTDHIVVIDERGDIQFINKAWIQFGENNNCLIQGDWTGVNYLKVCDESAAMGDEFGKNASAGIRGVINNENDYFYYEYPCHSPVEHRWFLMKVTPFKYENNNYYVIAHQNITQRKLVEEKANQLARYDGLTGLPNRRYFDEFYASEWRRCQRLNLPITLAILDIDHFKLLNDKLGHQIGDYCLQTVANILSDFTHRPGDMCARYGGEEFILVFGNNELDSTLPLLKDMLNRIKEQEMENPDATGKILTASIGVATITPDQNNNKEQLISLADKRLYAAKHKGRNRIVAHD
ncbi:MAG: diguanylate cyclase [Gammaproteobacteria bacterium]|nr:diguanylate cyclase [Gammaproteobacteria bacterium]